MTELAALVAPPAASLRAGEIERAEDTANVVAAREALARIAAGEKPVPLADLRAELGLRQDDVPE